MGFIGMWDNTIPLFLNDFRSFVRTLSINSEENPHPVFYFEDDTEMYFYKPIKEVLYYTIISKSEELPENLDLNLLKRDEFNAIEIPEQILKPRQFSGIIS